VYPLFTFKETKNANTNPDIPFQSDVSRSLSKQIDDNINRIIYDLGDSSDLIIRKETIARKNFVFAVIHIDGISDYQKISDDIIEKLLNDHVQERTWTTNSLPAIEKILSVSGLKCQSSYTSLLSDLLFGETILLVDNETS
jgi:spore germination protein KA